MRCHTPQEQTALIQRMLKNDFKEYKQKYSHLFVEAGRQAFLKGQNDEALQSFSMALKLNPFQFKCYRYWLQAYWKQAVK
jgi:hypothetical protein